MGSKPRQTGRELTSDRRRASNRRRRWLFRALAATTMPALFLVVLEVALRLLGYGFTTSPTVPCRIGDSAHYCDNTEFGWRFFPRHIAREFDPFAFPAAKSANAYRVFILGASAAQGIPDSAFGFGRILEVMLRAKQPQTHFEVITMAMPAINSHVVREIARHCARYEPNLFVVYLGNNEVVGPYGAGTVFGRFSWHLPLIRANIAAKATRLGQLISHLFELGAGNSVPQRWDGMRMFLQEQVRHDDPRLARVYHHFRQNLEDICRIGSSSGAAVILSTVGVNLKGCPPFASLHRRDLGRDARSAWEKIYKQGAACEIERQYSDAMTSYLKAAEIDDAYADLHFRLGRCYWAMGRFDEARRSYVRARELDSLRFRADVNTNDIIRSVARQVGAAALLVDSSKVLEACSPHGVPGDQLFHDHVHLNFSGNYLVAKAVLAKITSMNRQHIQHEDDRPILTEMECARRLAYTDYERYQITHSVLYDYISKPPFTSQLYHEDQVRRLEQKVMALKATLTPQNLAAFDMLYQDAIQRHPRDWWRHWKYAHFLSEQMKDDQAAAEHYRFVKESLPHSPYAYVKLGFILARLGSYTESQELSMQALKVKRRLPGAYFNMGLTHQRQGEIDRCIEYYVKALDLKPDHQAARNNLVRALCRQQRFEEAEQECRRGLLHEPESALLHRNLAVSLLGQGHKTEAIVHLETAITFDPNSTQTHTLLRELLTHE